MLGEFLPQKDQQRPKTLGVVLENLKESQTKELAEI